MATYLRSRTSGRSWSNSFGCLLETILLFLGKGANSSSPLSKSMGTVVLVSRPGFRSHSLYLLTANLPVLDTCVVIGECTMVEHMVVLRMCMHMQCRIDAVPDACSTSSIAYIPVLEMLLFCHCSSRIFTVPQLLPPRTLYVYYGSHIFFNCGVEGQFVFSVTVPHAIFTVPQNTAAEGSLCLPWDHIRTYVGLRVNLSWKCYFSTTVLHDIYTVTQNATTEASLRLSWRSHMPYIFA